MNRCPRPDPAADTAQCESGATTSSTGKMNQCRETDADGPLYANALPYRRVGWCRLKRSPAMSITSLRVSERPAPISGLKPVA